MPGLKPWSPESQYQEGGNRECQGYRPIAYSDVSFTPPALSYSFIKHFLSVHLVIILTTDQFPCPDYSYPPPPQSWISILHESESGLLSLGTRDRSQQKSRASRGVALTGRPSLPLSVRSNLLTPPSLLLPCPTDRWLLLFSSCPTHKGTCFGSWSVTNLL